MTSSTGLPVLTAYEAYAIAVGHNKESELKKILDAIAVKASNGCMFLKELGRISKETKNTLINMGYDIEEEENKTIFAGEIHQLISNIISWADKKATIVNMNN